jgi:hypothetical protein
MPALVAGRSLCGSATSAPCGLLRAKVVGDLGRDGLDLNADPAAWWTLPLSLSCATTDFTVGAGIAKAMPTEPPRGEKDGVVDADHVAVDVERRAAGIAFVGTGCIDLNEVVIGAAPISRPRAETIPAVTVPAEAERIADREYTQSPTARSLLGESHIRKVTAAIDLDQRDVGARIGADHLGV